MSLRNAILCLMVLVAMSFASCVREDISGCSVVVAVRDKNYDNTAEVGAPLLDENMPMLSYLSFNSMILRNRAVRTGTYTVYDEGISSGELVHPVAPTRFSPGVNNVNLIGGHSAGARQYVAGQTLVTLHPDGAEGEDIYMGHDGITYPLAAEHTIWLYRTKGMLIVEPVNMPADARSIAISISGLCAAADSGTGGLPLYSGSTTVSKSFEVNSAAASERFSTILAPSVDSTLSPLSITFTLADGTTESLSLDIVITRNHITLVRPEYNVLTRVWTIEVMVDGNWVKIDNLNITD